MPDSAEQYRVPPRQPTIWDVAPANGAEVMYRGRPASVVRVVVPGQIRGPVDLLIVEGGSSELHRDVLHDIGNGWSWPSEEPPPEPGPDDRLREAQAAGVLVPAVGSRVVLIRARPRSYRGTTYVPVPVRVDAVHDATFGPGWPTYLATLKGATPQQRNQLNPAEHCRVILSLTVVADAAELAGLEEIEAGQRLDLVPGPVLDFARDRRAATEGWARGFQEVLVAPQQYPYADRPCERCGAKPPTHETIRFYARDQGHHLNVSEIRDSWLVLCRPCAEEAAILACRPITRPPVSTPAVRRPTQAELDDTDFDDDEEAGNGAAA